MSHNDTIVAIATPPGRGGIGVVRVSGPRASVIAREVLGQLPQARYATYAAFRDADGSVLDQGIALYFPAPHSFTGQEVLELQGHGGPVVLDMLLQRIVQLGARMARPGEFSERAFLNHKLDLAQAEAVADLIESGSVEAARSAMRSLQGDFSRHIHVIVEQLISLRTYVEAAIDFPEEEIDFLADDRVVQQLDEIDKAIAKLLQGARQGRLLHDGMTLVIAGRPNVGKSSLLNALAQQDSAIVSHIPGTTRDVLREHIQIDGLPLHIIDTAGLHDSADVIEVEGIRRAQQAMQQADRVLLLIDDSQSNDDDIGELLKLLPEGSSYTLVRNKIDISGRTPGISSASFGEELAVSVMQGDGMAQLRQHLKACMGYQSAGAGTFMARRRHVDAIERTQQHLRQGREQLQQAAAGELLAEELRLAQQTLSEITGEFSAEDLLGQIFASFCIGK